MRFLRSDGHLFMIPLSKVKKREKLLQPEKPEEDKKPTREDTEQPDREKSEDPSDK
jgi:hypothetical protein